MYTDPETAVGRALFWNLVLSGGRDVSCASCHHPAYGYADGLDVAIRENGQNLGAAIFTVPTQSLSASPWAATSTRAEPELGTTYQLKSDVESRSGSKCQASCYLIFRSCGRIRESVGLLFCTIFLPKALLSFSTLGPW